MTDVRHKTRINNQKYIFIAYCIIFLTLLEALSNVVLGNMWALETTTEASSVRWKHLWSIAHKENKFTGYGIDQYHPELGWEPISNVRNFELDEALVNINSFGARGTKEYAPQKPQDIYRIVITGDSYTFGQGVNDDQVYTHILETKLENTEVINLAVHGYGIDQAYLRLKTQGLSLGPDAAILAFTEDDLNRNLLSFRDYMKPKFIISDNKLQLTNTPIYDPEAMMKDIKRRPKLPDLITIMYDRFTKSKNPFPKQKRKPIAQKIWEQTIVDIRGSDIVPILLYLPTGNEMLDIDEKLNETEAWMFETCDALSATCISARPYLSNAFQHGAKFDHNPFHHYDSTAHTIVARGLAADLQKMVRPADAASTTDQSR